MKRMLTFFILFAFVTNSSFIIYGQESKEKEKQLSLKEAIFYALKNNLDLQVQVLTTENSWNSVKINGTIFIPQLDITFNTRESNSPSTGFLAGADVLKNETRQLNLTLTQALALGGAFTVQLSNSRSESNATWNTVNPSLNSVLNFSLSQPLLKGFGTFATKKNIYIAMNNNKKSELQLKQTIIDLIYTVEDAYWNLVYAYQYLDTVKMSLERSRDLLKQNELKVRVGVLPQIDILDAQAQVAVEESNLIQAGQQIQSAEENLKKILNMSMLEQAIIPTDRPSVTKIESDFNAFLLEALENRPDIQQAKLDLKNNKIEVRYARNQLLPDLQLTASYWTTGQGGDQLIIEGNPFFGTTTVVGIIKKDIWKTINDTVSNLYQNFNVGLQLKIPLSYEKERTELALARLNLRAAFLNLKKTENTIYSEVKEVIKSLELNKKLVEARRISLDLEERKLKAEEKKYSVGLVSNYQVLMKQRDLIQAQTNHLLAQKNFKMTIADINKKLGRTFKAYDIEFKDFINNN